MPPAARRRASAFVPPRRGACWLALAFATAGCAVKGEDNANLILGKQTFVAKCGACHTLARANTKGIVGPNLDEAFRASIAEGLERNTIRGVVEGQVQYPNPEGVMPKDLISGATLSDVAAYVSQSADRPGQDTGLLATAVPAPGAGKPAVEKAGKLEIPASPTGQLEYVANKATATAGTVTITMSNMSGVSHNIAIEPGSGGATANGLADRCEQLHHQGQHVGNRQPEARNLHLLLPGPRPPCRGDVRHAHRQVTARTLTGSRVGR